MYLVHLLMLGEQETNSVRDDLLAFTMNRDFFASYPWGRLSYEKLLGNLNREFNEKAESRRKIFLEGTKESIPVKYTVAGFWQAFIVSNSLVVY